MAALVSCAGRSSPPREQPSPARVVYEGTGALEGHFRVPGETRPFHVELELAVDGELRRVVMTTWMEDDRSDAASDVRWLRGDAVIGIPADGSAVAIAGADAAWTRQLASAIADGGPAERPVAHPTFGDVVERTAVDAATLELRHHESDHAWTATLRRGAEVAPERLALPASAATVIAAGTAEAPPAPRAPVVLETIAPGVHTATIATAETVSLVVEQADGLVVAESSLTVADGEALVDALAERFPDKPIRHVLFGHYHPHYTGGLRAFIAAGATVHAPPRNAAFARAIAERAFTLAPDRLARRGTAARIESFTDRRVLDDADGNALVAIDIGAASDHTEEYVVFYVPRARLLFQGDLGWGVRDDGTPRAGRRAPGLRTAIDERALDVATLVQGWPIMPGHQTSDAAAWRALVDAR
jgi:glyoxylase-like metal-dependent hydrolase (beta-lactamase superfamily II)